MNAIIPNWSAPPQIKAFTTIRTGGVSLAPFNSFNIAAHVADDPQAVKENRQRLKDAFCLPQDPLFLTQIHSTKVLTLPYLGQNLEADAVYTATKNQVCLVMTADCLPVIFTNQQGTEVAAAHAGWRGLCDGILEQTVAEFKSPRSEIMAWLGPAIGPNSFQVGKEVMVQFIAQDKQAIQAFHLDNNQSEKYLADLYKIAILRLNKLGVSKIYGGDYCTYQQADKFFSYRREETTGRMATLIWIAD